MADDRDLKKMMSQYEREADAEGNQRARGVNAVSNFIERNNDDFQKGLKDSRNDIGRITEKASRMRVDRMSGVEGIREIEKSVSGILSKVGYVFDVMGRSVVKISTITKETLQSYKNVLQRELNISAPNTVAIALSKATPIFGYFAAKFMETGVFRKFSDAIKNKLSDAANVVGTKFKSMFRAGEAAKSARVPQLQKGGYVSKTGLAQVHAAEVVVPVQKFFKEFSTMFRQSIKPVTSELGAIREQLVMISEPNPEEGPFGIYGTMRNIFKEIPIFKTFIKITDWLGRPLRWLFSTESKYKSKVPKGPNVLGNIATTLGMIYADFMYKYDHILSSLKAIGMGLGVPQERFRKPREHMEPTGIQKIRLGARGVKRWWKPVGKKEEGMFDKIKRMLGFGGAPEEGGWESPSQKAAKEKRDKVVVGGMGGGLVQKAWETMLGFAGVGAGEAEAGGIGGLGALRPKNIKRILFGGKYGKVKEAGALTGARLKKGESVEETTGGLVSKVTGKPAGSVEGLLSRISKIVSTEKTSIKIQKTLQDILDHTKGAGSKLWNLIMFVFGSIGSAIKSIFSHILGLDKLFPRTIPLPGGGGRAPKGGRVPGGPVPTPGGPPGKPKPKGPGGLRKGIGRAGLIAGGLGSVIGSLEGIFDAKEMGTSKVAAGIGGALSFGNLEGGVEGAFMGGIMGASIGANFGGPWGIAIGGIAGALLGGIGGKRIAKAIDWIGEGIESIYKWVKKILTNPAEVAKMVWGAIKGEKSPAKETGAITGEGLRKMPGVDIEGLQDPVRKNLSLMGEEYLKETGDSIQVNSAYRSAAKQAELRKTNPYAAPPGKSPHQKGLAVDINSTDSAKLNEKGLMQKYGFYQPMENEPWHLQRKSEIGDPGQFNVPYRRRDLINGEVENAMMGINGMNQALNPMIGALDKSLKGVNAAIISNSNVITSMQSNSQNGGGRQSSQGSFDLEIAAILSGNI